MFDTFFYNPVYNFIIFVADYIPDLGIVIILTTIIIKLLLYPLFKKQIHSQIAMKKAKPELDAIAKKSKDKTLSPQERQQIGLQTMEIYKKYKVNPFSMIFVLIIQIPIVFALYWVFYKSGLPTVNDYSLYSFVPKPDDLKMTFLNIIDLTKTNYIIALLAGITQYIALNISMPDISLKDLKQQKQNIEKPMEGFAKTMQVYMKYGLPVLVVFILSTSLNAAIGLYWLVSNIFTAGQEYSMRHKKAELKEIETKEKK